MSDIGTHASYTRGPPPQGQQKSYEFSEDEKRVMAECRSESFWYRALPFSIGAGGLTRYLLSRGILTTGTRFGAAPKVLFASIFGYMVGKGTYIFKCQEKIMRLENSQLAEALRKRRMPGGANNQVQMPPSPTAPQESNESFGVPLSDTQRSDTHVNHDIDTSNVKNIDDYETLAPSDEPVNEKPKMTTTYEDLRNQNRRNVPTYSSQYAQPKAPAPGPASQEASQSWEQGRQQQTSSSPVSQRQQDASAFPLGRSQKNKYGDDWE